MGSYWLNTWGHGTVVGVEIDGTEVTEGWVIIARELYYVPRQALPVDVADDDIVIVPDLQFDPAGLEQFADGQNKNTYRRHWAKLIDSRTVSGGTPPGPRIGESRPSDWARAVAFGAVSLPRLSAPIGSFLINGATGFGTLTHCRDGLVVLDATVTIGSDEDVLQLPASVRPSVIQSRVVAVTPTVTRQVATVDILLDGRVQTSSPAGYPEMLIQVSWYRP